MQSNPTEALSLEAKLRIQRVVVDDALHRFASLIIMWTGGKDSMLAFDAVKQVCQENETPLPPILFIDHGLHFPETWSLFREFQEQEGVEGIVVRNHDILNHAKRPGDRIRVSRLSKKNQEEVHRTGFRRRTFPYALGSVVGNHLLKTVPMNRAIETHNFEAVVTGIRWDENEPRSRERFISPRLNPPHVRVHPVLHLSEREVWMETFRRGLMVHPLYEMGYRSLDGRFDSIRVETVPAWEQDLEGTAERAGRAQDKEQIMERLRELGYM